MSTFEFGSFENFDEKLIQIQGQEEDKSKQITTVQLVDEITAVYKTGNCENQEQQEKISGVAREKMEDSITKFRYESGTEAEKGKAKKKMHNKLVKMSLILILCFLLLNFALVVIVMNWTSEISSSLTTPTTDFSAWMNQTNKTGEIVDGIKFELNDIAKRTNRTEEKLESHQVHIQSILNHTKIDKQLEALEKEIRELKNSHAGFIQFESWSQKSEKDHEELKKLNEGLTEQFESLSQKLDQLESNVSSLLTPAPAENGDQEIPALESIASCSDAMENLPSPRSKKQTIYPHGNTTKVEVLCDFENDGGGWTIIQKRSSGPKDEFNRTWAEYANGFGSLDKNFWLGLDNIHALTKNGDQELRIDMEDFQGEKKYAKYSHFSISDALDFYRLAIGGFYENSTAGDSMTNPGYGASHPNNGARFSTWDKDNDFMENGSCVNWSGGGGWWHNHCSVSGLNGLYFGKGETVPSYKGVWWHSWKGGVYSLAKTEMKIRTRK